MKNKLAENMLRFGTKNLTESNIIKLTEARAPEDTFANDSDKVKQHPIYEAFKKRWLKGGDFISGFNAWAGAGGTGNAASTRTGTRPSKRPSPSTPRSKSPEATHHPRTNLRTFPTLASERAGGRAG